jgi:polyisoprenoid-binding protein YceI
LKGNRLLRLVLIGLVLLVVAVVGGTYLYINVFSDDAPAPLTAPSPSAASTAAAEHSPGTIPGASPGTGPAPAGTSSIAGTWKIGEGSVARYRVNEILFGQRSTAVGSTDQVTGALTVDGTTLRAGEFSVDMKTVKSDKTQRDNQFNKRIMQTDRYPTGSFKLTRPVELAAGRSQQAVDITGDLTLHGTTKSVTFKATATQVGADVNVTGTIPVAFADYNIGNPSGGPAQTEDDGILEFSLNFTKA